MHDINTIEIHINTQFKYNQKQQKYTIQKQQKTTTEIRNINTIEIQ